MILSILYPLVDGTGCTCNPTVLLKNGMNPGKVTLEAYFTGLIGIWKKSPVATEQQNCNAQVDNDNQDRESLLVNLDLGESLGVTPWWGRILFVHIYNFYQNKIYVLFS